MTCCNTAQLLVEDLISLFGVFVKMLMVMLLTGCETAKCFPHARFHKVLHHGTRSDLKTVITI